MLKYDSFIINVFSQLNKTELNAIYTLSNLIAELLTCTTWHTTCSMWKVCDVLQAIFTRLHPGHLSVLGKDSLWRSEETAKISDYTFK